MDADTFSIHCPWTFIHSDDFNDDIIIEEVNEIYSTLEDQDTEVRLYSRSAKTVEEEGQPGDVEDQEDESDLHEQKFILRFLATNTKENNRYLWVDSQGDVRSDGYYGNLGTFFEVIHWMPEGQTQEAYQIICYGGSYKNHILYMDGTTLRTRPYVQSRDNNDITTKFQMVPRGKDTCVVAFISKTGIPLYFDDEGNFRPEGPPTPRSRQAQEDTGLQPLFFIVANVKFLKVSSV